MRSLPTLDRTLIIAPHPDDDVIAAGGLIQRVVAGGGEVSVVYVTDGENNPWPQRYMKRKWRIGAEDRAEWGAMRRQEALASLERLRVSKEAARFLAFPDQKITELTRRGDMRLRDELRQAIESFRPTLIVSPSAVDLHSDHRAIAWYAHAAAGQTEITTYVVHGAPRADRLIGTVALSEREQRRKREAIECHASQLLLSRARFLAHVAPTESFCAPEFDLVQVDSMIREWSLAMAHALGVVASAVPAPAAAGSAGSQPAGTRRQVAGEPAAKVAALRVQPTADVQDRAGDVTGLL
jgi:LmbE family N-acetylglucosaminyl deacetylase